MGGVSVNPMHLDTQRNMFKLILCTLAVSYVSAAPVSAELYSPGGAGDRVHWSWDGFASTHCENESGNVTIVPGSGGDMGQKLASCAWDDGRGATGTATLYCKVSVTAATSATGSTGALSLQAHCDAFSGTGPVWDGPVVHSGCSTVMIGGQPAPHQGQCCFAPDGHAVAVNEPPRSRSRLASPRATNTSATEGYCDDICTTNADCPPACPCTAVSASSKKCVHAGGCGDVCTGNRSHSNCPSTCPCVAISATAKKCL